VSARIVNDARIVNARIVNDARIVNARIVSVQIVSVQP